MQTKHYTSILAGILFLSLAAALWTTTAPEGRALKPMGRTKVSLDRVEMTRSRDTARFSGVIRAKNRAVLSFTIPARLMKRTVDAGSNVRRGQILAQLDDREFRNSVKLAMARVAELEAQWKQAGRDRRRLEALAESDVISVSDLEKTATREAALAAALKAASARLNEARRLLGESVLKAPFSGTVTALHLQPGEWAVPGQPVIELTGDGDIELLVEVPETFVGRLAAGQVVQIELPFSRGRRVQGRIDAVAKVALTGGRLFPVKVDLVPEAGIKAGLTAQLIVDLSTEGVLTVPLASVVNPGGSRPYVFIYHQGRVARRPVTVEGIIADRIIVRGEIAEGDRVVTSGQSRLAHGDPVEVLS